MSDVHSCRTSVRPHSCFSAFEDKVEGGQISRNEKCYRKDLNYTVRVFGMGWESYGDLQCFVIKVQDSPKCTFLLRKYRSLVSPFFVCVFDWLLHPKLQDLYSFFSNCLSSQMPVCLLSLSSCYTWAHGHIPYCFLWNFAPIITYLSHAEFQYLLPLLPF